MHNFESDQPPLIAEMVGSQARPEEYSAYADWDITDPNDPDADPPDEEVILIPDQVKLSSMVPPRTEPRAPLPKRPASPFARLYRAGQQSRPFPDRTSGTGPVAVSFPFATHEDTPINIVGADRQPPEAGNEGDNGPSKEDDSSESSQGEGNGTDDATSYLDRPQMYDIPGQRLDEEGSTGGGGDVPKDPGGGNTSGESDDSDDEGDGDDPENHEVSDVETIQEMPEHIPTLRPGEIIRFSSEAEQWEAFMPTAPGDDEQWAPLPAHRDLPDDEEIRDSVPAELLQTDLELMPPIETVTLLRSTGDQTISLLVPSPAEFVDEPVDSVVITMRNPATGEMAVVNTAEMGVSVAKGLELIERVFEKAPSLDEPGTVVHIFGGNERATDPTGVWPSASELIGSYLGTHKSSQDIKITSGLPGTLDIHISVNSGHIEGYDVHGNLVFSSELDNSQEEDDE